MGKLTLFPYNSCILVQLDILATIPSLAYVALVFTVCKPSWVNSPYFRIILAFWSNLTFWPLFSALADAAQIFTVCRPSWVNSSCFHIILEFWFNLTFWPIFDQIYSQKCLRELRCTLWSVCYCLETIRFQNSNGYLPPENVSLSIFWNIWFKIRFKMIGKIKMVKK